MAQVIARALVAEALALATCDPTREVCGLLLGRGGVVEALLPTTNVAADPSTAFEVDPAALVAAHRAARAGGPAVLGCYHSHPLGPAIPSARDLAAALPDQLWLILGRGRAALFRRGPAGFESLPIGGGEAAPCLAATGTP